MEYKDFRIEHTGCTVVYGGTKEERDTFEKIFLSRNPEYRLQMLPCLQTAKRGLFGKKKTILDLMLEEADKSRRDTLSTHLNRQSKTMNFNHLLSCTPDQLGYGEKMILSYVFEIANGRRTFLMRDDDGFFNDVDVCELFTYLQINGGLSNTRFVWLTGKKIPDFLGTIVSDKDLSVFSDVLFRNLVRGACLLHKCNYLYRLQFGNIYQEDKEALHLELKEQAKADYEAAKQNAVPRLQEAEKLCQNKQYQAAMAIYEELMQQKIPEAFFQAGKLLFENHMNDTKNIHRGSELLSIASDNYLYPPANIYRGNFQMKILKEDMAGKDRTEYDRDVARLKSAEKHYAIAARGGSAEGAYLAAKVHLDYTSTEGSYGDVTHEICSENAVPFIHMLMKLQKDGNAEADYYLRMLKFRNLDIYQWAEASYGL